MIRYVIPFAYFQKTRARNSVQFLSWFFVFPLPAFLVYHFYVELPLPREAVLFFVQMTALFCIYELGYIENDTFSIEKEERPRKRAGPAEIDVIRRNYKYIVAFRYTILAALVALLQWLVRATGGHAVRFLTALAVLQVIFLLYNRVRTVWNLPLFVVLVGLRYFSYGLPFISAEELAGYFGYTFLIYPLPNLLEWSARPGYRIGFVQKLIRDIDLFRVFYYAVLSIVAVIAAVTSGTIGTSVLAVLAVYFLAYRTGALLVLKRTPGVRNSLGEGHR
jgi:hypothetical protein